MSWTSWPGYGRVNLCISHHVSVQWRIYHWATWATAPPPFEEYLGHLGRGPSPLWFLEICILNLNHLLHVRHLMYCLKCPFGLITPMQLPPLELTVFHDVTDEAAICQLSMQAHRNDNIYYLTQKLSQKVVKHWRTGGPSPPDFVVGDGDSFVPQIFYNRIVSLKTCWAAWSKTACCNERKIVGMINIILVLSYSFLLSFTIGYQVSSKLVSVAYAV